MYMFVFFCKQKTAYEMRISDWSSDVCSSDLSCSSVIESLNAWMIFLKSASPWAVVRKHGKLSRMCTPRLRIIANSRSCSGWSSRKKVFHTDRSEEHTSELQSLMRISYAVFCLKKKNTKHKT